MSAMEPFGCSIYHVELFTFRLYRRFGEEPWARYRCCREMPRYDPTLIGSPDCFELSTSTFRDADLLTFRTMMRVVIGRWAIRMNEVYTRFYIADEEDYILVRLAL